MKAIAFGILLLASPSMADKMIHDNKQKVKVDCTKDKAVHVHGNDAEITLEGTCDTVMLAGNKAKVVGSATTVLVSGNNNTVDLDGALSIKVTGNDNTISYKKSLDAKKPVGVDNTGNKNKVAKAK